MVQEIIKMLKDKLQNKNNFCNICNKQLINKKDKYLKEKWTKMIK